MFKFVYAFAALMVAAPMASAELPTHAKVVAVDSSYDQYPAGTIVIHAKAFKLDLLMGNGEARRYSIAVPKSGKEWSGTAHVDGKYDHPAWSPPAEVKHDHPNLPDVIPGGAPNNPMGAAALTLDRDEYAIHGTANSMRPSIGHAASYGCIRMLNEDITDLYQYVEVGALVVMED